MIEKKSSPRLRALLVAAATVVTLAACGGGDGGSGAPPTPPPAPNVTPTGGTVVSNDGKVRLVVPAGAVSGSSRITIEKVDPDAATAADPLYLAGSSYRISGDVGNLALPAIWEMTADAPLSASRAKGAGSDLQRVRAASVPALDTGKSCNGSDGKPMGGEWVIGDRCPTGCKYTGSFTDVNQTTYSSCHPIVFYAYDTAAPFCDFGTTSDKSWVQVPPSTNPLLYAEFAANVGPGVLCALYRTPSPPVLVGNVPNALNLMPCTVSGNTLSCKKPQVKPGVFKVLADTQAPTDVTLHTFNEGFKSNAAVGVTLGLDGMGELRYGISGQDERVATTAELWEIELDFVPGPNGPQPKLTHILRATVADTNSTPKVFVSSGSPPATLPFNATDRFKRYFFARLYDSAGNSTDSPIIPATRITPVVDVPSFTANPATLPPPAGTTTLTWSVANALTVSIDQGVGDVTAQTVNGSGSIQVNVNTTRTFTLTATGPNNTTATRTVTVTVAPDTAAPTVTLVASPGTVLAPGATTLTVNATDNVGVTQVELYRGATLIGTDSTPGDGFAQTVNFTTGDQGNVEFTARAFDAAGNQATSSPINVLVTVPMSADRYVSPTGSDANPGTQAQPYRTLTRAFANVGTGGTVWLENGTYTWAVEATAGASQFDFKMRALPPGRSLRALNSGQVQINFGFTITGDATLSGIRFASVSNDGPGGGGGVITVQSNAASNSTIQLKGLTFGAVLAGSAGGAEAVILNQCGTCSVTLDTNGAQNFNYLANDFQHGGGALINAAAGTFTVNGGRFESSALTAGSAGCSSFPSNVLFKGGASSSFNDVSIVVPESGGGAPAFCPLGQLTLANTTVTVQGAGRQRLFQVSGHLVLNNSTITSPGSGQLVGLFNPGARLTANGSTLDGGAEAIGRNVFGFTDSSSRVTLNGTTVRNVQGNAIDFNGSGITVEITDSVLQSNLGNAINLTGTASVGLTVRHSSISGSAQTQGTSAIVLGGGAGSVFDLGTAALPGGNTILGHSSTRPGVRVGVAGGVTVNAVGNTWVANQQGASGTGTYSGTLVVTSGSGQNYAVTSGALRLSGN